MKITRVNNSDDEYERKNGNEKRKEKGERTVVSLRQLIEVGHDDVLSIVEKKSRCEWACGNNELLTSRLHVRPRNVASAHNRHKAIKVDLPGEYLPGDI